MGVDKVKRQLNKDHGSQMNGTNGHGGLTNNYGGTGPGPVLTLVHHSTAQTNVNNLSFSSSLSDQSADPGNGYQDLWSPLGP